MENEEKLYIGKHSQRSWTMMVTESHDEFKCFVDTCMFAKHGIRCQNMEVFIPHGEEFKMHFCNHVFGHQVITRNCQSSFSNQNTIFKENLP